MERRDRLVNFRDSFQGNVDGHGKVYRGGMFFSSKSDTKDAQEAIEWLEQFGIKTIIDLRSSSERKRNPKIEQIIEHQFPSLKAYDEPRGERARGRHIVSLFNFQAVWFEFIWPLPFYVKWIMMEEFINKIGPLGLNKVLLEYSSQEIAGILRVCTKPENFPVMVHCTYGKDRTGVIVAIIMACCGVDRRVIVEDYLQSNKKLEPLISSIRMVNRKVHLSEAFDVVSEDVIVGTLEYMEAKWGGVHGYLTSIGFTSHEQAALTQAVMEISSS